MRNALGNHEVAIFWDYENCPAPSNVSGYSVVKYIRNVAQSFGSIKLFKAYLEVSTQVPAPRALALRSELQSSGVSLTDCPHNGRKDVADKMIIVDMLAHAIDHPAPSTIFLISGDRDFAYAISILRLRQYNVVLLAFPNAHVSLTSQASACLDWAVEVSQGIDEDSLLNDEISARHVRAYSFGTTENGVSPLPTLSRGQSSQTGDGDIGISQYLRSSIPSDSRATLFSDTSTSTLRMSSSGNIPTSNVPVPNAAHLSTLIPARLDLGTDNPAADCSSGLSYAAREWVDNYDMTPMQGEAIPTADPSRDPECLIQTTPSAPAKVRSTPMPTISQESLIASPPEQSQNIGITPGPSKSTAQDRRPLSTPGRIPLTGPQPVPSSSSSMARAPLPHAQVSATKSNPILARTYLAHFKPLVEALEHHRGLGSLRPLRSNVAVYIIAKDKMAYKRAGVTKFSQYVALAQTANLVEIGGYEGTAWISLRPD